jgi:hypothetical protein
VNSTADEGAEVTLAMPLADPPDRESTENDLTIHREAPQLGYREPHLSLAAIDAQRLSSL